MDHRNVSTINSLIVESCTFIVLPLAHIQIVLLCINRFKVFRGLYVQLATTLLKARGTMDSSGNFIVIIISLFWKHTKARRYAFWNEQCEICWLAVAEHKEQKAAESLCLRQIKERQGNMKLLDLLHPVETYIPIKYNINEKPFSKKELQNPNFNRFITMINSSLCFFYFHNCGLQLRRNQITLIRKRYYKRLHLKLELSSI